MSKIDIRTIKVEDAPRLLHHMKIVLSEGKNLLISPKEFHMTTVDEEIWIKSNIEKNNFTIVAEKDGEIVGLLNANRGTKVRVEHLCSFGISIQEKYCNQGIGSKMITRLLEWAKQDEKIEKVYLEVFAENERAIHVYEKFGFKKEGIKEKHIKFEDGSYADEYLMGQFI
ncbi:GNAT family N-acetyltransferase [Bacillus alkalisoli]|uniref:GNAT family N-acetyltransferase n=1 Tax=Bacillus alkalisoli TaxID=2011008 RepID=UPI001D0D1CB0|nr:GNAT family protein [Bacillus alkalisoli]